MKNKIPILIGVIWLFCISGIIGILSPMSSWFLKMTPLNLGIMLFIILLQIKNYKLKTILILTWPFLLGFLTEFIGVNYGFLFGDYSYGKNLGIKFHGVPIIICCNWLLLTIVSGDVAKFFFQEKWKSILAAAVIMTLLDILLEFSAPRFDFWEFYLGKVPLKNYLHWFMISIIAQICFQQIEIKTNKKTSYHILGSLFLFFSLFLIL